MKRTVLIFLVLITVLSTTVFALTGSHTSGITWELDPEDMQFVIRNTDRVYEKKLPLDGIAAVYDENGKMISVGMARRSADGAIYIDGSDCALPAKYSIRFFLLNEEHQPVKDKLVFAVGGTSPGGNQTPWG